jgi:hypothetical protein
MLNQPPLFPKDTSTKIYGTGLTKYKELQSKGSASMELPTKWAAQMDTHLRMTHAMKTTTTTTTTKNEIPWETQVED